MPRKINETDRLRKILTNLINGLPKNSEEANKKTFLKYKNDFEEYLDEINIPRSSLSLTLNVLLQGNIPLTLLDKLTYSMCTTFIINMAAKGLDISDMSIVIYGLVLIAESVENNTQVDWLKYKNECKKMEENDNENRKE